MIGHKIPSFVEEHKNLEKVVSMSPGSKKALRMLSTRISSTENPEQVKL